MSRSESGPTQRFRPRPGVLSRELAGEAVLLDPTTGAYFGLNATGLRVWALIGEGRTRAELTEQLLLEFAAPRGAIEADLAEILAELTREGLLIADE